jgi:hypothetical protein
MPVNVPRNLQLPVETFDPSVASGRGLIAGGAGLIAAGETGLINKAEAVVSQRFGLPKEDLMGSSSSSSRGAGSNPSSAEKLRPKLILTNTLGDVSDNVAEPIDTSKFRKKLSFAASGHDNSHSVADLPAVVADVSRIVVKDEDMAKKNDAILQAKLMEAKAMNRRDGSGAAMFKFSLWDGAQRSQPSMPEAGRNPFKVTITFHVYKI